MTDTYRTHTNGALNKAHIYQNVRLVGWVQTIRDLGAVVFLDLRDRYGITQIAFYQENESLIKQVRTLGREYVIQVEGKVVRRAAPNKERSTGEIEVAADGLNIINTAQTPPFTIDNQTDGGDELRMKYRYLDIRRNVIKDKLLFRHKLALKVRQYLSDLDFVEIETPYLIKSTPEGARDFVVPSRVHPKHFYALPQSPQIFKQLLIVGGMDRYFQIVKCFRDEDLRTDRQPEFTQIDCEMAFVNQQDVLKLFEGLTCELLKTFCDVSPKDFPRISYQKAMDEYGSDKPDIRFDMRLVSLKDIFTKRGFPLFDSAAYIGAISLPNAANYTRKQIDALIDWVKRPQIGASGLIWIKYNEDKSIKSSIDKFFDAEILKQSLTQAHAKPGDLLLIMAGDAHQTKKQLGALRLEMGQRLGLRNPLQFAPLWVIDFPLLEYDTQTDRYNAMHHPFTSPMLEDIELLEDQPEKVRACAYDLVINGHEIGGGSIRIHSKDLQQKMFSLLGFTKEQAEAQFGFLMDAFQYGAPPHGGIAFGLDRLVCILSGEESIRDFIAFPKNNAGRDVMIDAPSPIDQTQLKQLGLS